MKRVWRVCTRPGVFLVYTPIPQCLPSLCALSLQFVSDGIFRSELNSFLKQELAEDGYSGVEVRVTPTRTEIIILATRTQNVLGEKGRRIRELTAVVQKRFNFPEGTVEVRSQHRLFRCLVIYYFVASVAVCGEGCGTGTVCHSSVRVSQVQAHRRPSSQKVNHQSPLVPVLVFPCRACYGVLRFIMESGAKGCEVVVSGKLRGQRAKSMKFVDGLMIHAGNPIRDYIDSAITHVHLRQGENTEPAPGHRHNTPLHSHLSLSLTHTPSIGVLGIKVKIMLPHDPTGKSGPKKPLPDHVSPTE